MLKKSFPSSLVEQLEYLFIASSPAALRRSLLRVYMQYVIDQNESLPSDFESIACDVQLLVAFLDEADTTIVETSMAPTSSMDKA